MRIALSPSDGHGYPVAVGIVQMVGMIDPLACSSHPQYDTLFGDKHSLISHLWLLSSFSSHTNPSSIIMPPTSEKVIMTTKRRFSNCDGVRSGGRAGWLGLPDCVVSTGISRRVDSNNTVDERVRLEGSLEYALVQLNLKVFIDAEGVDPSFRLHLILVLQPDLINRHARP